MTPHSTRADGGQLAGSDGRKQFGPTPAGEMVTLHASAEQTDGRYDFMTVTVDPGPPVVPLHIHHGHDEAFYVLDGTLEARVGERTTSLTPGTFVVMPAGVPHAWRNAADGPSQFVLLYSPGGHVGVLEDLAGLELPGGEPDPALFDPILAEYDIERVGPPLDEP